MSPRVGLHVRAHENSHLPVGVCAAGSGSCMEASAGGPRSRRPGSARFKLRATAGMHRPTGRPRPPGGLGQAAAIFIDIYTNPQLKSIQAPAWAG